MEKKIQIFVSSTFKDLIRERQLVMEAILEMGHLPAGMEYFVSDDEDQFDIIKKWIDNSDAVILILGGRYGTINKKDSLNRSYTHLEYDYAHEKGKPIKVLLLSDKYLNQKKKKGVYTDNDIDNFRLREFRENIGLCNEINSINDVKNVTKTMINGFKDLLKQSNCGWIKLNQIDHIMHLYSNDLEMVNRKQIKGDYDIFYYSTQENRCIYSLLHLKDVENRLVACLENDISVLEFPRYKYNGAFDIYDDYLYLDLKSCTDNEKVFAMIKLFPGELRFSMGIIVAQGTFRQIVTSKFIILKHNEENLYILNRLQKNKSLIANIANKIVIEDQEIKNVESDLLR